MVRSQPLTTLSKSMDEGKLPYFFVSRTSGRALGQVLIGHGEYGDVTDSKRVQLAKRAKATITGEPPNKLGEHRELNIS